MSKKLLTLTELDWVQKIGDKVTGVSVTDLQQTARAWVVDLKEHRTWREIETQWEYKNIFAGFTSKERVAILKWITHFFNLEKTL